MLITGIILGPYCLNLIVPEILNISTDLREIALNTPIFFKISYIAAAVSPAAVVVVPRMIKLMEKGYGKEKHVPQLVMAGASVDDIYVIVLFTTFLRMAKGDGFSTASLLAVPISIVTANYLL